MKNPLRCTLALLLCLLLMSAATVASAASTPSVSKVFSEVPTLKLVDVPKNGTESGDMNDITISASLPGFLNLYLIDESGAVALTIADQMEIHSEQNVIDFYAVGDNGEPLSPGTYTVSADMVSQFGVASETVTKETPILASTDQETAVKETASETKASEETASEETASKETSSESTKTTASTDEMEYTEGEFVMGDEGLLIGVGVSDTAVQTDSGYWGLTADATDEEIWAAITRKMIGVDVGENESAYIYDSPEKGRQKIGTVSGISQGLNVITSRDDGWSLVETFRNEDGAFVRGYIKTNKLREVEPNTLYGIVIDKTTQTLTVYKDGTRLGSCLVTTGLPTTKYPHRETPAGEFITVTRRGAYEYYGMGYTRYTIRIHGGYYLAEVPTTKKNGSTFLDVADSLGEKATRGMICVAHDASTDGGINAEWIWDMTDENKKVKVLIFDDKARTDVPVSSK